MPSERVQRRIDQFLDEAEEALARTDWETARQRSEAVLSLDPENEDAATYLAAVARGSEAATVGRQQTHATPASIPAPQLPDSFAGGRYRVERFLGEGGKKRVFLAHDTTLDRDVAFGQFRTEGMDAAGRARVTQEAQAMGRVGAHPNLVNIYDIGEEAGAPFIVQEYVSGGSLADLVGDDPLPLEQTLQLAQDVCSALSFIHEKNLVHRDIKPSNVFLTEDGSAKVGDFGLAVGLDRTRITMQGGMIGTPSYMPPEQALAGDVTPQSDLYSLGAMLYELVTGRPPFIGDDPTSVISQHINTPPVAPSWHSEHCPPELEEVILRCLAKVPEDRPESAAEVGDALSRVDPDARSATHSDSGANPLDRLARGVFVGREGELERLQAAFDEAYAGRGSVVMLVGEAGIGKTRATQELETYARMRGARPLWGRAHESAGMPAYYPWVQVGNANARYDAPGDLASDLTADQNAELTRIFPVLRELGTGAEPEAITDPEAAQFRLFDAYVAFMRAASQRAPLLIVLDDLHWADKPSLLLLQHLARELAHMRILVIGTYRDTDIVRTHPLSEVLASLNREAGFERVVLRGLSVEEVGTYIRHTAQIKPSPSLVTRLHEETEGNPFFLSEVVNLMTQEGTLSADSVSDIALPDGVKEALGRRLDRLSDQANELLQVAAVSGREFRHEDLAALGDQGEEELFELLEESLGARVVEETGAAGQYRFTHALMQETLLDELSTTRKVRLHGRIGEALEQRWGQALADQRATRLAQHFVEAANLTARHAERAFHYSKLAAEATEAQAGWREAARHYEDCLKLLEEAGDSFGADEAHITLQTGICHRNSNAQRDGWRRMLRALDLYRARGEGAGMARAALAAARVLAPAERQLPLLEEALAALGDADPHLEALLRVSIARRTDVGADGHLARATTLVAEHGFVDVHAALQNEEAEAARWAGAYSDAAAHGAEATLLFESQANAAEAAEAYWWGTWCLVYAGKPSEAQSRAEAGIAYSRSHHLTLQEENIAGTLGGLLLGLCRFDELDELLKSYPEARTALFPQIRTHRALLAGDFEGARAALPSLALAGGQAQTEAWIQAVTARVALLLGERDAALAAFESMREAMERVPRSHVVDGLRIHYDAIATLDAEGIELADQPFLRAWFHMYQARPEIAPITVLGNSEQVIYGNLALALGEDETAERAFRENIAWAEREGADIIAGRSHLGLVEVARRNGDLAAAMTHLDAAQALFVEHRAKLFLDRVIALRLELQGAGSSDSRTSLLSLTTSVEEQRPDVASHAAPDGTVTLLFSDIEGSTALNVELGDDAWMQLLGEHNRLVRDAIASNGGFEVKTEGDAFMVAFQSARDAVRCAQTMQAALEARNGEADHTIRIRIGLHTGEPVKEADDFYGTHVVLASRIASTADGGEILVSSLLRDLVASSGEFELTAREPVALKGLDGEHVTYAVGWGP